MFGEVGVIIGQALSIVAVITGVISLQTKTARTILCWQIITALIFSAHYFLIGGAMTAVALNLLSAIKCVCYYFRNKKGSNNPIIPIIFTLLIIVSSILTWDGWYSALLMVGLVVNSIGFALPDPQAIRKLNLIKSPLCLVYNALVFSTGGIIYEAATFTSAVIGIIRNKDKNGQAFSKE